MRALPFLLVALFAFLPLAQALPFVGWTQPNDTDRGLGTAERDFPGCSESRVAHLAFRPYADRYQLALGYATGTQCGTLPIAVDGGTSYFYPTSDVSTVGYHFVRTEGCGTTTLEIGPFRGVETVSPTLTYDYPCFGFWAQIRYEFVVLPTSA
ncbi:MAG TPA: hypothetical protein VM582_09210 [Candidatus Thermoplasmatota archaeon]|nr:hypothetical protein [Candidatus Thermoplasmatota archaeon]